MRTIRFCVGSAANIMGKRVKHHLSCLVGKQQRSDIACFGRELYSSASVPIFSEPKIDTEIS
jgi:hypothetical protein